MSDLSNFWQQCWGAAYYTHSGGGFIKTYKIFLYQEIADISLHFLYTPYKLHGSDSLSREEEATAV